MEERYSLAALSFLSEPSVKPAVSILLPCRDEETFLPECLDSLGRQTDPDFEVVAIDDGSRDATRRILEQRAARDDRLRVVSTPATGLVAALQRGVAEARAPLLARMDADDVAHPERVAAQRSLLDARPGLAGCGTRIEYFPRSALGSGYRRYERWLNALETPEELARDLFVECPVAHPTLMLRAEALREVGGYRDAGWPEDYDLVLRLHASGRRLANVPRTLHRWRVREGRLSMTSSRYSSAAFQRCKAFHLTRAFLPGDRPLVVWGAGSVGKGFLRALRELGAPVEALVDLDPRKIGQRIHGAAVLEPDALLARAPHPYVTVAVGSPGARDEIREVLDEAGYVETRDYRAVA